MNLKHQEQNVEHEGGLLRRKKAIFPEKICGLKLETVTKTPTQKTKVENLSSYEQETENFARELKTGAAKQTNPETKNHRRLTMDPIQYPGRKNRRNTSMMKTGKGLVEEEEEEKRLVSVFWMEFIDQ